MEGMEISANSNQIDMIIACREQSGQQVEMLFSCYEALSSDDARGAFVAPSFIV